MNSSSVTIVSTKEETKRFVNFIYSFYEGEEHWVPPLRMDQKKLINTDKNPFFENAEIALFLAEKDGKDVGRIAAIVDHRFNEFHGTKTGHFGFFECINDQHTANLLFRVASDWLKDKGMTKVLGPASPSMMDTIGVLIEGYDKDPYILMPYNYPYYDELILNSGFSKEMDMYAYIVDTESVAVERMEMAKKIVKRRIPDLEIRPINLNDMDSEIKIVREIFNQAWKDNWGFIPLSEKEFEAAGKDLKMIIDTDFAHVAEVKGEPIGFSIGLPNINEILKTMNGRLFPFGIFKLLWGKRKLKSLRTALMGVIPKYQGKGVDALLHQRSIKNGLENEGKTISELSWILETNTEMIRVAERIGGKLDKTYRMYSKEL
ncbi:MAG: GNAT family N-acetyltransferase [Gracilimonas sp.]|uniref:GNAT family N-acetyltransferase n=1 Tax=Gracilimonas sp. TaxID=1974203 RepID=UPI001991ACE7|nr:GNAT family N-acetyltransferase [Gracilimonas sp.]MBD3616340.1 GNAT family N-acetyltransferase [Gracilimonas sp.]